MEVMHPFISGWRYGMGHAGSQPGVPGDCGQYVQLVVWSGPGLCLANHSGRSNIVCVWSHKDPTVFSFLLCWYWVFVLPESSLTQCSRVPDKIYLLFCREMNFLLPWRKTQCTLQHFPAHSIAIFFPFPLPMAVGSAVSHHSQLWQKHTAIQWWAPLIFHYSDSTYFTKSA